MAFLLIDMSSPKQLDGIVPTPDSTVGALLLGTLLGLILYGCAVHQTWRYFVSAPNHGVLLRAWIFSIMLVETLHSAFCIHMCYYFLISRRFNHPEAPTSVWSQNMLGILTGSIILACQSFISRWIYSLRSEYRLLVIVVALLLSIGQFAAATSATVLLYLRLKDDSGHVLRALDCTQSVLVLVANVVLTSALCYHLWTRRTGYSKTGSLIREITRYTLQGGVFLFLLATSSLIVGLVLPNSQICSAIDIVATKIYANMLLAIVNSRSRVQNDATPHVEISTNNACYSVLQFPPNISTPSPSYCLENHRRNSSPVQMMIKVDREVQTKVDKGDAYDSRRSASGNSKEGYE